MTEELVIQLGNDALRTTALLAGPLLGITLVVGLAVSIFQALTQINEATLSFIPKILAIAFVFIIAGPWMMDILTTYTTNLFENIATMVRE